MLPLQPLPLRFWVVIKHRGHCFSHTDATYQLILHLGWNHVMFCLTYDYGALRKNLHHSAADFHKTSPHLFLCMPKLLILDSRSCRHGHIDVLNDLGLVMKYPSMTGQKVRGGQCGSPPEKLRLFLTRFPHLPLSSLPPPTPLPRPWHPNHTLLLSSRLQLCVVVF